MLQSNQKFLTNIIKISSLLLFLSNCFSFQESDVNFTIQDPIPKKRKQNLHAWIKLVNLPEYKTDLPKENRNPFITYKLYKYIRESNQFESTQILYTHNKKLPENSIVFDFQFSALEEKNKFHSLYFPFGILGLGISRYLINSNYGFLLFTALGGPDSAHRIEYKGNLVAYNFQMQEKARTSLDFQSEFSSNMLYYTKEKEANLKRNEMFEKAIENILKSWETK